MIHISNPPNIGYKVRRGTSIWLTSLLYSLFSFISSRDEAYHSHLNSNKLQMEYRRHSHSSKIQYLRHTLKNPIIHDDPIIQLPYYPRAF